MEMQKWVGRKPEKKKNNLFVTKRIGGKHEGISFTKVAC